VRLGPSRTVYEDEIEIKAGDFMGTPANSIRDTCQQARGKANQASRHQIVHYVWHTPSKDRDDK
jgi:hypothetical protein